MDKEVAKYITTVIAKDLDSRRPKGMMDCSSFELEAVEKALTDDWPDETFKVSDWVKRKLRAINNHSNIIPNFKVGDKVTNISGLFPEVGYTIAEVNEKEQYYSYKEVNGRTYFKDQEKLMLVKSDSSTTPVESKSNKDRLAIDATIARNNVQQYNYNNFDIIEYLERAIYGISKSGGTSCTTNQYMKLIEIVDNEEKYDKCEITKRIIWHFKSLGFNVKTEDDAENKIIKITISW